MKKTAVILIIFVLLSFSACTAHHANINDPVVFYYPQAEIVNGTEDAVIGHEIREASGHRNDLEYLLAVYLQGPLDNNLRNPFPVTAKIVNIRQKDGRLHLMLNAAVASKKNMELSIMGACLAKTCFDLTDFSAVHIESNSLADGSSISLNFQRENLILVDNTPLTQSNTNEP